MLLLTKNQKQPSGFITRVGMPQADAKSPGLFNIFMDELLLVINTSPSKGIATLFVDDVLLLARRLIYMQKIMRVVETRAEKLHLKWAAYRSCGLQLHGLETLMGHQLQDKRKGTYLRVALSKTGVTDKKLLERL